MLDMDGVLCDFDSQVEHYNARKENGRCDWKHISNIGSRFWSEMDWMLKGRDLFNAVFEFCQDNHLKLGILSAIFLPCGKRGKLQWIMKHCPVIADEDIIIVDTGIDKWKAIGPGDILIDDTEANLTKLPPTCMGILYKGDIQDVVKQLKSAESVMSCENMSSESINYEEAWSALRKRLRGLQDVAGELESELAHSIYHMILDDIMPSVLEKQINEKSHS